jgi:nucleoside-diphosphate-sugar epimerase
MSILITGNMGYVGPAVVRQLRATRPQELLVGFDTGFFANALTGGLASPECQLNAQLYGDIRTLPENLFDGMDAVVHLAAISNDPMGKAFEAVTRAINHEASIDLAVKAKQGGVKSFVFASSCSVYGFAEDIPSPPTPGARSTWRRTCARSPTRISKLLACASPPRAA